MRPSIFICLLFMASQAHAVSYPLTQPEKPPEETVVPVASSKLQELLGTNSLPAIPKSWKLIGVSNGEKSNASNLWFQAEDGSVYLLQGFSSQNKFMLHEHAYKIPAK